MVSPVSNPNTTFNIIRSTTLTGVEELRTLFIGQKTATGIAIDGELTVDIPRSDELGINSLCGSDSHSSSCLREYRKVNPYTNLDAILLSDSGTGAAASSTITWSGSASVYGTYRVTIGSGTHVYKIDVEIGDGPVEIIAKISGAISADRWMPFTATDDGINVNTFTINNKGTIGNDWPIIVKGLVAGLTYTITAFSGGANDPSLTSIFDPIENIRYQRVIWPSSYDATLLRDFLESRKNVDNGVMDGTGVTYRNDSFAAIMTLSLSLNSSEIIVLTNEPNDFGDNKGPHVPDMPDIVSTKTVAMMDLREEEGVTISGIVADSSPRDQEGGLHTTVKPFFNTPYNGMKQPRSGSGYSHAEIRELMSAGITVIGSNKSNTNVVLGQVFTTYQKDPSGNDDDTWSVYNNRLVHGRVREYFDRNFRKKFAQHRLSLGDAIEGYAIATIGNMRSFMMQLYDELAQETLTIQSTEARRYFEDETIIALEPQLRKVTITTIVPINSQLAEISGSIGYTLVPVSFSVNTA